MEDTLAALDAFERGELPLAMSHVTAAYERDPSFAPALLLMRALRQTDPSIAAPERDIYVLARRARQLRTAALDAWVDAHLLRPRSSPASSLCLAGMWNYFVRNDKAAAAAVLRRASDAGSAPAMCSLGYCYDKGEGVEVDHERAARLYERASQSGHVLATANLGTCYNDGAGVARDLAAAARLYRWAADRGLALAQYNLALCYDKGEGVERDPTESARLLRKAAEQGHAGAQFNLGICYTQGDGVTRDEAEAVLWYQKAAEQGHASALCNLGCCYDRGEGVQRSHERAVQLFRDAVAGGSVVGHFNLACCLSLSGPEQDMRAAAALWAGAVLKGHDASRRRLDTLHPVSM
eukprot:m51a1_g11934 hypothetical protein (351) ;mRNA; f:710736-711967